MKTKKSTLISVALLAMFLVGMSCASAKGPKKCDGKRGQKTNMGTM
jgi:PBP1b-binding outer membrane lipoprotein LpoB